MRFRKYRNVTWRGVAAMLLAGVFFLATALPALALDFNPLDYFQFSYDPVVFSKTDIKPGEEFSITVSGSAVCFKDLPISPGEAKITSKVTARHAVSGAVVTLNPSYTITIKPLPKKAGETFKINQSVPLKFPTEAAPGEYTVIGTITDATLKVGFIPVPVTSFLAGDQPMGTVKYNISEPTPAPENPPAAEPKPGPPPISSTPSSSGAPAPQEEPAPPPAEQAIPAWVWLIVVVAVAVTAFNVGWFLRRRRD
ncbi:MAG: hypothetical protein ABID71_03960 [Chloroflexota bacterium]